MIHNHGTEHIINMNWHEVPPTPPGYRPPVEAPPRRSGPYWPIIAGAGGVALLVGIGIGGAVHTPAETGDTPRELPSMKTVTVPRPEVTVTVTPTAVNK